jgi:hypothetical protein
MLTQEGASVTITSREKQKAEQACAEIKARFGVDVNAAGAESSADRGRVIQGAHIIVATGKGGVELLSEEQWKNSSTLEMMADANATPPLGLAGIEVFDKGATRHGKIVWGAIGFGTLKLALHRACSRCGTDFCARQVNVLTPRRRGRGAWATGSWPPACSSAARYRHRTMTPVAPLTWRDVTTKRCAS